MKVIKTTIYIAFFVLLFSCNKPTGPTLPGVTTTETTLKNLQIDIISSDSLIIRNGDSLLVNAMDVLKISVFEDRWYQGLEDSLLFLRTITPSYKNVGSLLGLEFSIPIKVNYPDYDKSFVLQFKMSDDTIVEVKPYVQMYKYPYGNVERLFRVTDIGAIDPYGNGRGYLCTPQLTLDFEIINNNLYFNIDGCGAWGISKYNFTTYESEYVSNIIWEESESPRDNGRGPLYKPNTAGGYHLAVDGDYLFVDCTCGGGGIFRINMLTDTISVFIDAESGETKGIEAANDTLYFIVENGYLSNDYSLRICDYDGEPLNNISLPVVDQNTDFFVYNGIESYKGILYIWNNDKILRLNLSDLTFLKPLISPLPYGYGGFDIHDDILYFGHDDIYWIELSELREVE